MDYTLFTPKWCIRSAASNDPRSISILIKLPPRKPIIHDLQEEGKICSCGCELKHISDEKSKQLEIIPAKIYVIQHIRKKYICKKCEETIKIARFSKQAIPRSRVVV